MRFLAVFIISVALKVSAIMITPTSLELTDTSLVGEFTLENVGTEEKLFQASIKKWEQKDTDIYTPTDEVIVLPLMANIAPKTKQKFRVVLKKPVPARTQRNFRLYFSETSQRSALNKSGLSFLITITVPIFANGKDLSPTFETGWSLTKLAKNNQGKLTLKNNGARTISLTNLALLGKSDFVDNGMHYILPGSEFSWTVSLKNTKSDDIKATYNIFGGAH